MTRWTDREHGFAPCRPGGSHSAPFPLLVDVGTGNPIVIRDFHPERVRRALARSKGQSWNEGRLKVVTESSKIEKGDEFLNDIVSSLPYCEATSEKRYGYHEVLIDDERIVGITVRVPLPVFENVSLIVIVFWSSVMMTRARCTFT